MKTNRQISNEMKYPIRGLYNLAKETWNIIQPKFIANTKFDNYILGVLCIICLIIIIGAFL